MENKAKMAAVGERDCVLAFQAMGMTARPTSTAEEAASAIRHLAREGYAVIFITEQAATLIPETLARYQTEAIPAIIPIPGSRGADGLGMQRLKANVEKAIGADILFEREG